jgi:hypothetical protein
MRVIRTVLAPAACLFLLAALPAAPEDLTVVSKVMSSKGEGGTATLYISSSKIRHSNSNHDFIFDLASGKMTMMDTQKKEYWETTAEERGAVLQKTQDQLASLPPAVRERMAGSMGAVGASVSVQKGTGTKKIAGYDCEQYLISMGESMRIEKWVTQELQIPSAFFDAQQAQFTGNPIMKNYARVVDEMRKIKGFPLGEKTTVRGPAGMGGETSREATEVKKGPIDSSVFAIPAGYTKVDSPLVRMLAGKK